MGKGNLVDTPESTESVEGTPGLDRRKVLQRGAILGGALVWTVPAVQTLSGAAFAAGSPLCDATLTISGGPPPFCFKVEFVEDATCCNCITTLTGQGVDPGAAVVACVAQNACVFESSAPC